MNEKNLQDVLTVVNQFVKSNRPAYKDYLGEETQDESVWQETYRENEDGDTGEQTIVGGFFTGGCVPKVGDTLTVVVNGEGGEYPLEAAPIFDKMLSASGMMWVGSINYATLVSIAESDDPEAEAAKYVDNWGGYVGKEGGMWAAMMFFCGKYLNATVDICRAATVAKYNIKKLPIECLPDETTKAITNARTTANSAQVTANSAQVTADYAQNRADLAYSRAGIQADWDQDGTAATSYIQNRPFYGAFTRLISTPTTLIGNSYFSYTNGEIIRTIYPAVGRIRVAYTIKTKDGTETVIASGEAGLRCQGITKEIISADSLNNDEEFDAECYTLRCKADDNDFSLNIKVCYENGKYVKAAKTKFTSNGAAALGYKWELYLYVPTVFRGLDSAYLPLVNASEAGAVMAPAKDDSYTLPVAADENGYLWTKPDEAVNTKLADLTYNSDDTDKTEFYLKSSTAESNKRFKITVDDTGALAATEVVE